MNRRWLTRPMVAAFLAGALGVLAACSGGSADRASSVTQADQSIKAMLPAAIRDAGVLRVGSPLQNPPVIYKSGSDVDGQGADMMNGIAAVMGLRAEYVETSFPALVAGLAANKFDVIGGVIFNDTTEREKSVDIVSLAANPSALLVKKGSPVQFNTMGDLCGHLVGALQGSVQDQKLREGSKECVTAGKPEIQLKVYPDAPTALAQLQAGRLDTFAATKSYAVYMVKTVQNGSALETAPVGFAGGVFGIAVPKGQPQLASAVQAAIKKMIADGQYAKINDKWGTQGLAPDEILINGAGRGAFAKYGGA